MQWLWIMNSMLRCRTGFEQLLCLLPLNSVFFSPQQFGFTKMSSSAASPLNLPSPALLRLPKVPREMVLELVSETEEQSAKYCCFSLCRWRAPQLKCVCNQGAAQFTRPQNCKCESTSYKLNESSLKFDTDTKRTAQKCIINAAKSSQLTQFQSKRSAELAARRFDWF